MVEVDRHGRAHVQHHARQPVAAGRVRAEQQRHEQHDRQRRREPADVRGRPAREQPHRQHVGEQAGRRDAK